jgi:hypothetical protein
MILILAKLGDKKISRDKHNISHHAVFKSMNLRGLYVKKLIFTLLFFCQNDRNAMKQQLEYQGQFLP